MDNEDDFFQTIDRYGNPCSLEDLIKREPERIKNELQVFRARIGKLKAEAMAAKMEAISAQPFAARGNGGRMNKKTVENLVARIQSHAHDYRCVIKLDYWSDDGFIISMRNVSHAEPDLYKFSMHGSDGVRDMVWMKHETSIMKGWVMEAIPSLMFAAMYAG